MILQLLKGDTYGVASPSRAYREQVPQAGPGLVFGGTQRKVKNESVWRDLQVRGYYLA